MLQASLNHLLILSKVLLSRLTRPNVVEVNIIDDHLKDDAEGLTINIKSTFGRFVGCFYVTEDEYCCFYLLAREKPDGDISHVYIYYLNSPYYHVQEHRLDLLRKHIPNAVEPEGNIKVGMINVIIHSDRHYHLSLFLEAIEHSLGPHLIHEFKSLQIIDVGAEVLRYFPSKHYYNNFCAGDQDLDGIEAYEMLARRFGIPLQVSGDKMIPNPKIGLVKTRGHYTVTIHHKEEDRLVNKLLIHNHLFKDLEHYLEFKNIILQSFDPQANFFLPTMLYLGDTVSCNDRMIRCAAALAIIFAPHLFFCLKRNEICIFTETDHIEQFKSSKIDGIISRRIANIRNSGSPQLIEASNVVKLRVFNDGRSPEILEPQFDSQKTIILDNSEVIQGLSFWKDIVSERQQIRDSIVPPIHQVEPFDDSCQNYLKFLPCYYQGLTLMAKLWSRYAKTEVIYESSDIHSLSNNVRFVIYSFKTSEELNCIIVIDHVNCEYIFLQPRNEEHINPTKFDDLTRRFRTVLFTDLSGYIGRAVMISNGKYFEDYPRIHLLMSLYVIFRLFRYSVELPKKVIHGEWELRKYASNICTQLQVVNSEFNIKNGLVDEQGYLKFGAKQSLPSPLRLETGVVPKDQCMFCKRRGFDNLGRHMSMQHGGQAQKASLSRL